MVVASDGFRIHKVETALLAGIHHVFLTFVIKDGRRHLHVQIALDEPFSVGMSVVVDQVQTLGLRILLHADDTVAVNPVLRIPASVTRSCIHRPVGADGGAGASPHASTCRSPTPHFVAGEIIRISRIRIAAATLSRVNVDNVLEQAQCIGLAIGRHKLGGGSDLLSVRSVHLAKAAIPGSGVDGVLAGRSSRADRHIRRHSPRAQYTRSFVAWLFLKGAVKVSLPKELTRSGIDRIQTVGYTGLDHYLFRSEEHTSELQ